MQIAKKWSHGDTVPTGVVDVQLVDDALVAAAEDDHEVLDGDGPVPVARPRRRPRRVPHLLPLEDGRRRQHGGGRRAVVLLEIEALFSPFLTLDRPSVLCLSSAFFCFFLAAIQFSVVLCLNQMPPRQLIRQLKQLHFRDRQTANIRPELAE